MALAMTVANLTSDLVKRPDEKRAEADSRKRRALVLTDETAQHPFRATLPPHIAKNLIPIPAEDLWRLTANDVRGFASTYIATTAAVLAFII